MTFLIVVAAILFIVVPIAIPVSVVGTRDHVRRLEEALGGINRRIDALPARLARELRDVVPPAAAAPPPAPEPPAPAPAPEPAPPAPPPDQPPPSVATPPADIAPSPPVAEPTITPVPEPIQMEQSPPVEPTAPSDAADTRPTSVPRISAAASAGRPSLSSPVSAAPPPGGTDGGTDLADFEKRFGTQWVVWVGGIALALGGIFLIRYSIEQGYFGPGTRVLLGAMLALALVGAGELTRRQEIRLGISDAATAHIPSILTAAGTTIAYATVYGAYALYQFLSPAAAFVLLGAVALATLTAALVHGPALAGLGLIGAYVTPLLVSTGQPSYWTLYVYLAVVTAAALALARFRMWRWLAITAIAFNIFWMFAGIHDPSAAAVSAHAFHVVVGFALSAVFIVAGLAYGPPNLGDDIDAISSGALTGFLFGAFALVLTSHHDILPLLTLTVLAVTTTIIALR